MPLRTRALPFDDPNWIFELKYDGFRALAVIDRRPQLVSRNGNSFGSFGDLAKRIAEHLPSNTVIDGEIVAVDRRESRDSTISCSIAVRNVSSRLTC
jgi:bifunctional non-homologous end joining protein LigD